MIKQLLNSAFVGRPRGITPSKICRIFHILHSLIQFKWCWSLAKFFNTLEPDNLVNNRQEKFGWIDGVSVWNTKMTDWLFFFFVRARIVTVLMWFLLGGILLYTQLAKILCPCRDQVVFRKKNFQISRGKAEKRKKEQQEQQQNQSR